MGHNKGVQRTRNARIASVINPDRVSHPRGMLRNARPAVSKATKPLSLESRSALKCQGFATVVRASLDKPALAKTLNLRPPQKIIWGNGSGAQRSRSGRECMGHNWGTSRGEMTLSLDEFLRRFLLHLLPDGFVRIRHFGLLANRRRATFLPLCFRRSALRRQSKPRHHAPRTPVIFGSVPSVLDRWWSSRGSPLPRWNFVLHLGAALPYETTLHRKKTLCASPRSVALRLIAEQISSSGFLTHSLRNIFPR